MTTSNSPSPQMCPPLVLESGMGVLHLFFKVGSANVDAAAAKAKIAAAVKACADRDTQVVPFAVLGHKAELGFMALSKDLWSLRRLQADLSNAGLDLVDSYVSITEVSEYAVGLPEKMIQDRLYPTLPPQGMRAMCFYPMSKRRGIGEADGNWFRLGYEERETMMREHGSSGRKWAGKIAQLITGSTGLDDFEWGVTLFAHDPMDLKGAVYTMRFDEASAKYGDFGVFITCLICDVDELCNQLF